MSFDIYNDLAIFEHFIKTNFLLEVLSLKIYLFWRHCDFWKRFYYIVKELINNKLNIIIYMINLRITILKCNKWRLIIIFFDKMPCIICNQKIRTIHNFQYFNFWRIFQWHLKLPLIYVKMSKQFYPVILFYFILFYSFCFILNLFPFCIILLFSHYYYFFL